MADNLTYSSIVNNIRENKINNLYLFYGSESLLIKDAMNRIEKKILNPSLKDINFIKFEGSVSAIDAIINACETLPFMDSKKIKGHAGLFLRHKINQLEYIYFKGLGYDGINIGS